MDANNGTITGATTGITGQIDDAYSFDGTNDYIDFGDNEDFEQATGSISVWINSDDVTTHSSHNFQKDNPASSAGGNDGAFNIYILSGILKFRWDNSHTEYAIVTSTTLEINTWYHV